MIAQSSLFSHKFHRRQVCIDTTMEANDGVFVMVTCTVGCMAHWLCFERFYSVKWGQATLYETSSHCKLSHAELQQVCINTLVCFTGSRRHRLTGETGDVCVCRQNVAVARLHKHSNGRLALLLSRTTASTPVTYRCSTGRPNWSVNQSELLHSSNKEK